MTLRLVDLALGRLVQAAAPLAEQPESQEAGPSLRQAVPLHYQAARLAGGAGLSTSLAQWIPTESDGQPQPVHPRLSDRKISKRHDKSSELNHHMIMPSSCPGPRKIGMILS